ncbi:MAG: hypothetical protein LCH37_11800 [Bacteroidetes bacterium]|nr:hypothetical protein [Bacteroidota bacterium]
MKHSATLLLFVLSIKLSWASLIHQPIGFTLSTAKEWYYEGEKITFLITITNQDKERTLPVLLPHSQNTDQKLFYLSVYDKANNTLLLRYSENKQLIRMVNDTGSVTIKYLKPLEQVVIPIYFNDFENYNNFPTQNASPHHFGVPLFAGIYKINLTYNPKGIPAGDSIYNYYDIFEKVPKVNGKQAMPSNGQLSPMIELKIKRSNDTLISINRQNYFIKTDGNRFYYFTEYLDKITTDARCIHITNLPAETCSLPKGEYFYNQFPDQFNEYIVRFDDGDIREYRKFTNWCPEYLYTERYNDLKQKINYELQLPDKRFYSVVYHQDGRTAKETYCSEDGTLCTVTTYIYSKNGELLRKKTEQIEPCSVVIIDNKKRSVKRGINLERN